MIPLTECSETGTFYLEQSFVARLKQTWRATELHAHHRVQTHEKDFKAYFNLTGQIN